MNGIIASIKSKVAADKFILSGDTVAAAKIVRNNINQPWTNYPEYLDLLECKKLYNVDYTIKFNSFNIDYDLKYNGKTIYTHDNKMEVELYLINKVLQHDEVTQYMDFSVHYEWINKDKIDYIIITTIKAK